MNSNSFAQASFVLFGTLLVVQFFITIGSSISGVPLVYVKGEFDSSGALAQLSTAILSSVVTASIFQLAPGLVLVVKGRAWADRLLPPNGETKTYIEYSALLAIGLTLLGYYFLVHGLAGVLGGLVSLLVAEEYELRFALRNELRTAVMLVSGAALVRMGRRAA